MESFLIEVKDYFNDFIWEQIKLAMAVSGPVIDTFKIVAFIFVLFKICGNLYNNPLNWWGYVSWLPLSLLLFNYDIVIEFFVDLSNSADESVSFAKNHELYLTLFKQPIVPEQSDIGLLNITVGYLKQLYRNMIELTFMTSLFNLAILISSLMYIFIKIKAMFRFIILGFFGPLSIALSFVPGNENNWLDWVMKGLETALYIPMLMFIDYLGLQVLEKAFKPQIVGADLLEYDTQIQQMWMGLMFFVMLSVSYFFIPKMVRWGLSKGSMGVGASKKAGAAALLAARKVATGGL